MGKERGMTMGREGVSMDRWMDGGKDGREGKWRRKEG